MRGVRGFFLPLPAKGGGRGVGPAALVAGRCADPRAVTHPNPSLGREGLS